jgi:hypothetical protein
VSNAFDQRYAGEMFDQPGAPPPGWAPQQPTPGLPASPPGIAAPSPASAYHGPGQVDPAGPHGNLTGSGGISALGPGAGNPLANLGEQWLRFDAASATDQSNLRASQQHAIDDQRKNQGLPPVPELPPGPGKPPESTMGQSVGAWLTAALAMAALGTVIGRTHAVNALTAFSGTVEGLKAGNEEQFKQQSDAWEKASRAWEADNKKILDKYKLQLENKKYSNEERRQILMQEAQTNKDQIGFDMLRENNFAAFARLQDARDNQAATLKMHHDEMDQREKDHKEQVERQERQFNENMDLKRQSLGGGVPLTDDAKTMLATRAAKGDTSAIREISLRDAGTRHELENMTAEIRKTMPGGLEGQGESMQQFRAQSGALSKATRDFATGPQGNTVRSFSVAISHLDTLQQLGEALQAGDVQRVNQMRNAWSREFGYDPVTNFDFAKQFVGDEVFKGVVGGIGTGPERQNLQAGWNSANSPQQLAGIAATARKLMGGQLQGFRQQFVQNRVGTEQDFNSLLSEPAQRELLSLSGSAAGGGPVQVQTPEEARKLPSGTQFLIPDGSGRIGTVP